MQQKNTQSLTLHKKNCHAAYAVPAPPITKIVALLASDKSDLWPMLRSAMYLFRSPLVTAAARHWQQKTARNSWLAIAASKTMPVSFRAPGSRLPRTSCITPPCSCRLACLLCCVVVALSFFAVAGPDGLMSALPLPQPETIHPLPGRAAAVHPPCLMPIAARLSRSQRVHSFAGPLCRPSPSPCLVLQTSLSLWSRLHASQEAHKQEKILGFLVADSWMCLRSMRARASR